MQQQVYIRRGVVALGGVALLYGFGTVLPTTVTRGYVTNGQGRPLADAHVVLADSTRVVMATRTDAAGYFRFVHGPRQRARYSLLICAPGHVRHVSRRATSALLRSEYGIGAYTGRDPVSLASRGWYAEPPASCRPAGTAPAG